MKIEYRLKMHSRENKEEGRYDLTITTDDSEFVDINVSNSMMFSVKASELARVVDGIKECKNGERS